MKIINKIALGDKYRYLVDSEIKIMRQLEHKHIVQLIESFEDQKNIFLVQTLCSNKSLSQLIEDKGFVEMPDCRRYMRQILKGVKYLHSNSIIHRDLKLSNIFLDDNMDIKIGDFGLAIPAIPSKMCVRDICDKGPYLAPEILKRQGYRFESDIWAIAVITYKLLNGYGPFDCTLTKVLHDRICNVTYR